MLNNYRRKDFDFRLVLYICALNIVGVLVIRSATNMNMSLVGRQLIGILSGFAIMLLMAFVPYKKIIKVAPIMFGIILVMLIAVLIIGIVSHNARRWIVLPVIGQLQPSEFAKVIIVIFFSWLLEKYNDKINKPQFILILLALIFFPLFLILSEPDLSTTIVVAVAIICMIYVAGISYKWILGALAVVIPMTAGFIYLLGQGIIPFLKDYQKLRLQSFFFRSQYAASNLQQDNSIMAIGSGQLFGKGLNNNTLASVKNGNFLSEEQTDFIFAVIGEELGFIGSTIVVLLYALIVFECLYLAGKARDMSGKIICTGMAAFIAFQAFCNIAVATGLFPNTGLPLPFISYGVSSLISLYFGFGIVLNVAFSRVRKEREREDIIL